MTKYEIKEIVILYYDEKSGKDINRTCQLLSLALSSCFTKEIDKGRTRAA